ncbi:MAG: NAD(P)/FAD-dependent oxidoreductase [Actinomycetota bacterium]
MPSKVLIIGAGPSGTACAATLHRLGHDVTVVDKATFPRDKCCGDGLTTNALRILDQLGFDPSRVPDWQVTSDVVVHSPTGRTIELALPEVGGIFAAIAPRSQFDYALVQHCRDTGITIHEGHAFVSLSENDTSIAVEVEGLETFTVDYVVAADGMWSPVRKAMGLSTAGYLGEWHAFRQYISNVTGTGATQLHVWFEKDLLPGYAWSFPLPGNRVNFGYGILRTSERSTKFMNDTWRDLLTRPHIREALGGDFVPEDRHTAWPIPARIDEAVRSSGRVLFIGDAVCATDTLTGEGIGQALETGIAAAESIDAGNSPVEVRTHYSRAIDKTLLADHRMSVALSSVLARPFFTRLVLSLVDTNNWTRTNFARWMFEDEPRAIVLTPRRWHRKFLSRSGAYES